MADGGDLTEEWREVMGGAYKVSNLGNVMRATDSINTYAGRAKATSNSGNGYMIFGAFVNGKRTSVLVHRAVAEAFIGPCPEGFVVNHKDGIKGNNRIDNLEYVTVRQNAQHASAMGLLATGDRSGVRLHPECLHRGDDHWTRRMPDRVKRGAENGAAMHPEKIKRGDSCPASKLKSPQVLEIRRLSSEGASDAEIARRFSVTPQNVRMIVLRRSWKHLPPA